MARPTKHQQHYRYVGRATKLTPDVIAKLEQAAQVDASIRQMCFYANISVQTYYNWIEKNPELLERLEDLRQRRPLKANQNITAAIEAGNLLLSQWELEKKQPDTYGEKLKIEHSGSIADESPHPEDEELLKKFHEGIKENIRRRAMEKAKQSK